MHKKNTTLATALLVASILAGCSGSARTDGPRSTGQSAQALTGDLTYVPGPTPANWLPVQSLPLTAAFQAAGLPETGTGYFTIGAPTVAPPYFDRFTPSAPTFLCFQGAYVIDGGFPYASDWENPDGSQKTDMQVGDVVNSAEELVKLGNADQFFWLEAFPPAPVVSARDPGTPLVIVPARDIPAFDDPKWDGFFLVNFEVDTVGELGADPSSILFQGAQFYPPYSAVSSTVEPFAPYVAEAFVLIKYDVPHADFVAVYGNGVNWHSVDGRDHNTSITTILQITSMMAQSSFQ